jgi:hypothetical protein
MKRITLVLLLSLAITGAQCPPPPPGYDPYPVVPATAGMTQVPSRSYYPPASTGGEIKTHLRFEWQGVAGKTYEVQYTHSLTAPIQWYAYARVTLGKSDVVLCDHPIYTCEPARFFRVTSN